jgi:DNA-binding NtrC family response regulator
MMKGVSPRVLIIEDEEKLAGLIARILKRAYDVSQVAGAPEALDWIAAGERFDLILCDVMLPRMTGPDFVERLGQLAPELVERVVFMTGGAFTPSTEAFVRASSIPVIEKPFGLDELLHLVMEHCQRLGTLRAKDARRREDE